MNKFTPYIPLLIGISILVGVGLLIFFLDLVKKEEFKIEKPIEKRVEKVESLKHVYAIEDLIAQVTAMDLPKYNKDTILKVLDLEKYMIEAKIVKQLGKNALEEMKNGEK